MFLVLKKKQNIDLIKNVDYLIFVKSFTDFREYVAVYSYVTTELFIFKSLSEYVCIYKSLQIGLHLLVFPDMFAFLHICRYLHISTSLSICSHFCTLHVSMFLVSCYSSIDFGDVTNSSVSGLFHVQF